MRFLETHESVIGLAGRLGLKVVDFLMGGPGNFHYLRHTNLQVGDYQANPDRVPYHLLDAERGLRPWQLVIAAFLAVYPALAGMSVDDAREYLKTVEFDGRPLWQLRMPGVQLLKVFPRIIQRRTQVEHRQIDIT